MHGLGSQRLGFFDSIGGPGSVDAERVHCIGRVYTFSFVPSGFFGRIIVRVLNSLAITNFVQSMKSASTASAGPSLTASTLGTAGTQGTNLHPAMQVLWANGLVMKLGSHERLRLEFEPANVRLFLHYRYAGLLKPGRSWNHVVAAVNNVISEWYQIPSSIDVICSHCLEEGRDLSTPLPSARDGGVAEHEAPTLFKFSHCEMEYYRGLKTLKCVRKRPGDEKDPDSISSSKQFPSMTSLKLPEDSDSIEFSQLIATSSSGLATGLTTATVSMVKERPTPRREFKDRGRSATLSAHNLREGLKKIKTKKDKGKESHDGDDNEKQSASSISFSGSISLNPRAQRKYSNEIKAHAAKQQSGNVTEKRLAFEDEELCTVEVPLAQLIPDITTASESVNVIATNDLEMIKQIGVGGFAVVFKGSYLHLHQPWSG